MYFLHFVLALFLALGLATGLTLNLNLKPNSGKLKLKLPTNKKIHGLQQQTEVLAVRDPQTTQQCFNYYTPILSGITDRYEKNYGQCNQDHSTGSELVILTFKWTLYDIQEATDQGCKTFWPCGSIVDYVEAFQCFASAAADESKIMYQVSADATEAAGNMKIDLQTLDTQLELCVTSAEREYVEGTIATYEDLNKCLNGGGLTTDTVPGGDWDTTTDWYTTVA
ncbi:uncharacterized protein [Drosophila kikkawai]|uniref:Protein TsetseEP domain-containing protein n=1 Tax=Drosophila kikkawai TaxID=30033 RepID=A0A6P4I180_DROKI|nr:uncharacterized protein LOC108074366 [Drosophila kikkawai]